MRRARSWATLALALGVTSGCSDDFPPFSRLDSLRVLSIKSEPASPFAGESATLTPLVFTPSEAPSLTYQWRWCPAPGEAMKGYPCLITEEELAAALGPGISFPSFDLGTGPTATLAAGLSPAFLAAVCKGMVPRIPPPNCTGGFPVQVRLTVRTDTDAVDTVVTAHWRFDEATQPPNANPSVDGLTATLSGTVRALAAVPDGDTVTLPRQIETPVGAVVAPETSETYDGLDDDGNPATLRERLFITWFVETGDVKDEHTSYLPDRTSFADLLKNTWKPAKSDLYPRSEARFYVVLHDNRGGIGWQSGVVRLGTTP